MVRKLGTVLAACLLAGCSSHSAAKGGSALADRETIRLLIKADPELNLYEKNPHALLLCLYQLKDPNGFKQLARQREGVARLLECGPFDTSVAQARTFVLQPGQDLQESGAKDPGARFLGVAAGYYSLGNRRVTEISPLTASGSAAAAGLLRIELGAQEIRQVRAE